MNEYYYAGDSFVNMNNNIAYKILENDTLLRLLVYTTPDALDPSKPSIKDYLGEEHFYDIINQMPDIQEDYEKTKIWFTPYILDTQETKKVELRFFIHKGIPEHVYLTNIIWAFQIVMSNSLQMLDGGINRSYLIIRELLKTFNGEDIDGVGELQFAAKNIPLPPMQIYKFSDFHMGYTLYAKNFAR